MLSAVFMKILYGFLPLIGQTLSTGMPPIPNGGRKETKMSCFFCKGEMRPSTTIHTVQLKNCVVVIKNVPCMKCEQCGEVVLSAGTVEKIEHILKTVEKAVAEITVVNFPDCAA